MSRWKVFGQVTAAHAGLLLLLLAGSVLKGCQWPKPKERIITVDLAGVIPPPPDELPEPPPTAQPEATQEALPAPTPVATRKPTATPTPRPTATPVPTATPKPAATATATPAPTATPRATATPKPTPTPKPTSRLLTPEEIRARIQQTPRPPAPTVRPVATLSAAQIEAMIGKGLDSGGSSTGSSSSGGPPPVGFDAVERAVYQRFYAAWTQPTGVSAASGLTVLAEIELARDGRVLSSRIRRPSGHGSMDQSVRDALGAVTFVAPLPSDFRGTSHTFVMEFVVTQ